MRDENKILQTHLCAPSNTVLDRGPVHAPREVDIHVTMILYNENINIVINITITGY